jgi:hypothetical protein
MAKTPPHPFPARSANYPNEHQIIYDGSFAHTTPEYRTMYERSQGPEARLARFQYLGIEEELERSFRFVSPSDDNANAYSLKFAEIIRAAANAYEIAARSLYAKFYNDSDEINILNYLALDRFVQLSDQTVSHFAALGDFPSHPEVCRPFTQLGGWDRNSPVLPAYVPGWWTAYNKVKHSNEGLKDHATLANAMAVTAAVFLLIERMYGFGVLQGGLYDTPSTGGSTTTARIHPQWGRLFIKTNERRTDLRLQEGGRRSVALLDRGSAKPVAAGYARHPRLPGAHLCQPRGAEAQDSGAAGTGRARLVRASSTPPVGQIRRQGCAAVGDRHFFIRFQTLNRQPTPLSHVTFRHTHVSELLARGESVVDVARRVGDRPEVILKTYAHFLPGGGGGVACRLDPMYG